jgi:hypothetical protein
MNKTLAMYFSDPEPMGYPFSKEEYLELNSRPGVQHPNWSSSYKKFNMALVEMLTNAIKDV